MSWTLVDIMYSLPFMMPMFVGGVVTRFGARNSESSWKISIISLAVAILAWIFAIFLSRHGSELPGICAYFVTGFPIGSFLCGVGLRVYQWAIGSRDRRGK